MEFMEEGIALGLDLLILGFFIKEYMFYRRTVNCLKSAPQLPINNELRHLVSSHREKRIPYAVIRGTVRPIGDPIQSHLSPPVICVLQVIKLCEHRDERIFSGFWSEEQNIIQICTTETPFKLQGIGNAVEIIDPLSAAILDLDVVYDNYEPLSPSFFDQIIGFFIGVRQKGLQTTEEVLRVGSDITAIGELQLDGQSLRLQSSPNGPLFLIKSTKASLIKRFEEAKSSTIIPIILCGTIATILVGFLAQKFYLRTKHRREQRRIKDALEKERRTRRSLARLKNLTSEKLCVVCSENPKEIIILPCGHVCLCEDCALRIQDNCPVCRGRILDKAAAFIT